VVVLWGERKRGGIRWVGLVLIVDVAGRPALLELFLFCARGMREMDLFVGWVVAWRGVLVAVAARRGRWRREWSSDYGG
jgi:hypothetical protein